MRKIFNIILYLLFIIVCLFLMTSKSSCAYDTTLTPSRISQLESLIATLDTNDEYDYFLYCSGARLILFNNYNENTSKFYLGTGVGNTTRVFSNYDPGGKMYYHIDLDNQTADYWGGFSSNTDMLYYDVSGYANLYSNVPVYDRDQTTLFFSPVIPTPATILNTTTQAYENNLENGSFEYIIISAGDYAQYPVTFHINNGQDSLDSPNKYKYIVLDHNSPYADISIEPNQYQSWTIPKADLIPFYNNYTYNMWLEYGENGSLSTEIYTWTTNFSQATIDNAVVDEQENIDKTAENTERIANELNETNQFLTSDSVDDNDIELPEISVTDFTLTFFTTLVGGLTDAFLNTSYDEYIEFDIRDTHYVIHSNQFNFLSSIGLSQVKNFVSLFWIFGIGYWIYCDARRRISLMKEFHWTAMFADDISVDML